MKRTTIVITLLAAALAGSLSHNAAATAAPAAAPAPVTLTLADAHGWQPDAKLDATQVEAPADAPDSWPLGTGTAAAVEAAYVADDMAAETAWVADLLADGWVSVGDIDGHPSCYVDVAATSTIVCSDGWSDES